MKLFVTGIGTGIGKTFVSAMLARALQADYWKPIQCGIDDGSDREKVADLVSDADSHCWPERHILRMPASPNIAAAAEGVSLELTDFELPEAESLVVEGAGGLLVPINDTATIADLILHLRLPVVLVCGTYLGCINHTLLSVEALCSRRIPIVGLIFNGRANQHAESTIAKVTGLPVISRFDQMKCITPDVVAKCAEDLREKLHELSIT